MDARRMNTLAFGFSLLASGLIIGRALSGIGQASGSMVPDALAILGVGAAVCTAFVFGFKARRAGYREPHEVPAGAERGL